MADVREPTLISAALTPGAVTAGNEPVVWEPPVVVALDGAVVPLALTPAALLALPHAAATRLSANTTAEPNRNRADI